MLRAKDHMSETWYSRELLLTYKTALELFVDCKEKTNYVFTFLLVSEHAKGTTTTITHKGIVTNNLYLPFSSNLVRLYRKYFRGPDESKEWSIYAPFQTEKSSLGRIDELKSNITCGFRNFGKGRKKRQNDFMWECFDCVNLYLTGRKSKCLFEKEIRSSEYTDRFTSIYHKNWRR